MNIFVGTHNEEYKKRLYEILSKDYKLDFLSKDEDLINLLHNAFNLDLLEEKDQDYTVVMVDKVFYDEHNIPKYFSGEDPTYFTLVMICDNINDVDLEKVLGTKTIFMMPLAKLDDKEIYMQIQLLIHNIFDIKKIQNFANFDALTKLHNRRSFLTNLDGYFYSFKRDKTPFCLAFIDLDHFKSINDNFGHISGDEVLSKIAGIMQHNCRKTDVVGRIGGEEFAIIFPNTGIDNAKDVLERVREHLETTKDIENDHKVTLSAGLVSVEKAHKEYKDVFREADKLLYKAKESGRNQICIK